MLGWLTSERRPAGRVWESGLHALSRDPSSSESLTRASRVKEWASSRRGAPARRADEPAPPSRNGRPLTRPSMRRLDGVANSPAISQDGRASACTRRVYEPAPPRLPRPPQLDAADRRDALLVGREASCTSKGAGLVRGVAVLAPAERLVQAHGRDGPVAPRARRAAVDGREGLDRRPRALRPAARGRARREDRDVVQHFSFDLFSRRRRGGGPSLLP